MSDTSWSEQAAEHRAEEARRYVRHLESTDPWKRAEAAERAAGSDHRSEDNRMERAGLTVEQRLEVARVAEQGKSMRESLGRLAEAMKGHRERNPEQYAPGARPEHFRQQSQGFER